MRYSLFCLAMFSSVAHALPPLKIIYHDHQFLIVERAPAKPAIPIAAGVNVSQDFLDTLKRAQRKPHVPTKN